MAEKRTYDVPLERTVRVVVRVEADSVTEAIRRAGWAAPDVWVESVREPTTSCVIGAWKCPPYAIREA